MSGSVPANALDSRLTRVIERSSQVVVVTRGGVSASLRGFAIAAILGGTLVASSAGASSAPNSWSVVPLPATPAYNANEVTITVAADGLGNLSYVPSGYCGYVPSVRPQSARTSHALASRVQMSSGPGCGIERYNPTTQSLVQLDPTHTLALRAT